MFNLWAEKTVPTAKILDWISSLPYQEYHNHHKRDVLQGTGSWLLEDQVYMDWKNSNNSSLLWLHGIPGAGKSKLVSIVVEDLQQSFQDDVHSRLAFFYCSRDTAEPERSQPNHVIASLARQLSSTPVSSSLLEPAILAHQEHSQRNKQIPDREGESLLRQLVGVHEASYIVIDAIDECDYATRHELLRIVVGLLDGANNNLVKILIASRDDQDIVNTLHHFPSISITSERNGRDISKFVEKQTEILISEGRLLRDIAEKEQLKEMITCKLIERANGMFRWVSLQLEFLCGFKSESDIRKRLESLPDTLKDSYSEIYSEITTSAMHEWIIGETIFAWLLVGQKILHTSTFLAAISANPMRWMHSEEPPEEVKAEEVLAICRNLVVHDEALDTFRFAHPSVREFLESLDDFTSIRCHSHLAETCLVHLIDASSTRNGAQFLSDNYGIHEALPSTPGLLDYAVYRWPAHCVQSGVGNDASRSQVTKVFDFFMSDDSESGSSSAFWVNEYRAYSVGAVSRALSMTSQKDTKSRSFLIACWLGFVDYIRLRVSGISAELKESGVRHAAHGKKAESLVALIDCDEFNIQDWQEILKFILRQWRTPDVCVVLMNSQLLSGKRPIRVTDEIICIASQRHPDYLVYRLLHPNSIDVLDITSHVLHDIVAHAGQDIVKVVLDFCGDLAITEKVVVKAARSNVSNLGLLLKRAPRHVMESVVSFSVESTPSCARILRTLEQNGVPIKVTEGMMRTAAKGCDAETMAFLLSRGGCVTEEIVISAIQCHRGPDEVLPVLEVLIANWSGGPNETEREKVLETSVTRLRGTEPLNLLFQKVPNLARNITPSIIEAAVQNE
ncbi:hypothetical protein WG66_001747 [Moniliophthora roreri]|nr:hypothetical protein WG66_001747 [Moniliophthora roreri]